MNRLFTERLGKPGIAALGVLIFCLAIYLGDIAPNETRLASLDRQVATLAGQRQAAPVEAAAAVPPKAADANAFLKTLDELARQHGLNIERASYQHVEREGRQRLLINLPFKASYPALRGWLDAVLSSPATPMIDSISFQRQQAGDPALDINLQISVEAAP